MVLGIASGDHELPRQVVGHLHQRLEQVDVRLALGHGAGGQQERYVGGNAQLATHGLRAAGDEAHAVLDDGERGAGADGAAQVTFRRGGHGRHGGGTTDRHAQRDAPPKRAGRARVAVKGRDQRHAGVAPDGRAVEAGEELVPVQHLDAIVDQDVLDGAPAGKVEGRPVAIGVRGKAVGLELGERPVVGMLGPDVMHFVIPLPQRPREVENHHFRTAHLVRFQHDRESHLPPLSMK